MEAQKTEAKKNFYSTHENMENLLKFLDDFSKEKPKCENGFLSFDDYLKKTFTAEEDIERIGNTILGFLDTTSHEIDFRIYKKKQIAATYRYGNFKMTTFPQQNLIYCDSLIVHGFFNDLRKAMNFIEAETDGTQTWWNEKGRDCYYHPCILKAWYWCKGLYYDEWYCTTRPL